MNTDDDVYRVCTNGEISEITIEIWLKNGGRPGPDSNTLINVDGSRQQDVP